MSAHNSDDEVEVQEIDIADFDIDALGGRASLFSPQMDHREGRAHRNAPCGCWGCMMLASIYGAIKVRKLDGKWVPNTIVDGRALCTPPDEIRKFFTDKVGGNEVLFSQAFDIQCWRAIAHDISATSFAAAFFPEPAKRKRSRPSTGSSSNNKTDDSSHDATTNQPSSD